MSKYFFEAINPMAPPPRGSQSLANRFPIQAVTPRNDGTHDIHIKYQGRMTNVNVDDRPKMAKKRNMIFRNEQGRPVEFKEVVGALYTEK